MNGRKWYVFYKPFERADMPGRYVNKVGWSVGVVYPEDDIAGDYNLLFCYLLIIALIGIILIFVFCRMITHRQLLPLDLLTHFTQRIAEGHYDESIPDGKSKDEVGRLQDHLQQMQKALAIHVGELEKSSSMQQERTKVLEDAYDKAQEADKMKMAFLHYITNQMIEPSNVIDKSVTTFCNNYYSISLEEADKKVNDIRQQSQAIITLLDYMLHTAENETRKEESHE
jgi:methyl-accepting chemotaxis protein/sigma-B regulation protein RsbU (phosphoserine phosphatase)